MYKLYNFTKFVKLTIEHDIGAVSCFKQLPVREQEFGNTRLLQSTDD